MTIEENFPVLTEDQVAEMLQISVHTLAKLRAKGLDAPPHIKIGGKIRYIKGSVEDWLKRNEIQSLYDEAEGE